MSCLVFLGFLMFVSNHTTLICVLLVSSPRVLHIIAVCVFLDLMVVVTALPRSLGHAEAEAFRTTAVLQWQMPKTNLEGRSRNSAIDFACSVACPLAHLLLFVQAQQSSREVFRRLSEMTDQTCRSASKLPCQSCPWSCKCGPCFRTRLHCSLRDPRTANSASVRRPHVRERLKYKLKLGR